MSTREKIAQIANRAVNEAEDRHRDGGGTATSETVVDGLPVVVTIDVGAPKPKAAPKAEPAASKPKRKKADKE